ncbi:methylenetetrahydrofolate reductase [NAD(P)H] [Carboxylicivirga sp. M1479]|uniref:methylenetetrahydrofolate reductase [NAD(P)H] n=1 Tax=Carboxylicivirga sp. M1479 TaxID=2594476 RepID=UPI0011778D34|nr:methylenetetrahydrofolate reductase [NAD(P)H] [Carboxylicivirga sp. M1479]TRX71631.1 methylenetetrahydrofolate reductase [NAD(P)H] [Carboxylicivirga sp. M1479]
MTVAELIKSSKQTGFSFELLPPLKGNSIDKVFKTIEQLKEFNPLYINITSHRDEMQYKDTANGLYERKVTRKRPGTVAVAASIQHSYGIKVVPHIICSGFTKSETEYALIDLNFLGIHDILVLRGDNSSKERFASAGQEGNAYAIDLVNQVNELNTGQFLDGTLLDAFDTPFSYGVAGYPEKHEEAPNMDSDLFWLKQKVDAGAEYIVTQMFFDNAKYFDFVKRARAMGITIPIVPGLKPITLMNQLTVLPKIFHVDIPEDFAKEIRKCKNNDEVKQVGVEWCIHQAKELIQHNVPILHFYTMMATNSTRKVAEAIY